MNDNELDIILQIQETQGNIAKANVLEANRDNERLKQILYYTFNPFIVFGISTKKINKVIETQFETIADFNDIIDLLEFIKVHNTGTDIVIVSVQNYLSQQPEKYQKVLKDIICKSLTIGMNTKSINKIWKDLIPTYEVQQGEKWFDYIDKMEHQNTRIIVTQKFDGQRCSCRVENGNVTLYSRNGKPYEGLHELENELSLLPNGMYDGELLLQVNSPISNVSLHNYIYHPMPSKELFKRTASIVNSDMEDKKGISIWLYDFTPLDNFDNMIDYNVPTIKRKQYINDVLTNIIKNNPRGIPHLHQAVILYNGPFNLDYINKTLDEVLKLEQEGLMINIEDAPYEFKRSRNMLKVKKMYPVDLEVVDIEEGTGINQGRVGALVVNYKGYKVKVGSGLTKEQRINWWNNPNEIIGRIITVQYFEETTNKNDDSLSLRFPVFKEIRYDKDEESYN